MTRIRVWWSRVIDAVLRRRRDDRLSEELGTHLDLLTDDHIARGMTPEDARLAARKAFGGIDQVRARYRDQRGLPSIESLLQDIRFAFRLLRRDRGFALTAVLVLGIGIGVNNMFFMIVYAHTLRSLPIPQADRVMYVSTADDHTSDRGLSLPDFEDLSAVQKSFLGLAAFSSTPVALGDDGRAPERFDATYLSSNAFRLIGAQPILGRDFSADNDRPGAEPVVILGASMWQARYGRDPSILGRTVLVNGHATMVIGVMPDRSGFPTTATVWLPLQQLPGLEKRRDARTLRAIGRVRDGVSENNARAEIQTIVDQLSREYPQTNAGIRARVMPINGRYVQRLIGPWLAFVTAGLLVVIISCANVANLMLSRSLHRAREIAIRTSLGASRARLTRQLLMESVTLAGIGGGLGLGLSLAGVRVFKTGIPANTLAYWNDYYMDARVFLSLALVSLATVSIFGLVPAIQASRTDVNRVLKDGGRSGSGSRGARAWTTAFLTAELALAVILLGQLGLSLRVIRADLPSDRAVNTTELLTATFTLPADRYTAEQRTQFYRLLDERLRAVEGIQAVSFASQLPMSGGSERQLDIEGRSRGAGEKAPSVWTVAVAPGYFETLRQPMVRGRSFTELDGMSGQLNAVVNERFVDLFFADRDPIGAHISLTAGVSATPPPAFTIVGVSPIIRQRNIPELEPIVYFPLRSSPPATTSLIVRSSRDVATNAAKLRDSVFALDPNLPLYRVQTMAQVISETQWAARISERLARTLTFIAVLLAAVGLYAVTARGVSQRTQEIGIRMALGARAPQVVWTILKTVRLPLGVGFVLGLLGIVAWDRTFSSGRSDVRITDPGSLLIITSMVAAVTIAACFVPARRATRLDPVTALRED
jgi:putative ABC transport system permease protein